MTKLIIPAAAALALALGATAAPAQTDESSRTTEVRTAPDGTQTTRTTTESTDAYGTYRKTVTATRRYDAGEFDAPAGYTYTRYAVGDRLPSVLLTDNYLRLSDYRAYELDDPPQGLEWIRVGHDALLVDPANGEVIQSDYDLFD